MTVKYIANQSVLSTAALVANTSTGALPMTHFSKVGFQLVWSGLSGGAIDAGVTFWVSNDGVNWDDISSLAFTITAAAGNNCVAVEDVLFSFIKVNITVNSVTGGSLNISATFKE